MPAKPRIYCNPAIIIEKEAWIRWFFSPAIDNRFGVGKFYQDWRIISFTIFAEKNIYNLVKKYLKRNKNHCVLVDEAQFLSKDQVYQLTEIVDQENIPVLA